MSTTRTSGRTSGSRRPVKQERPKDKQSKAAEETKGKKSLFHEDKAISTDSDRSSRGGTSSLGHSRGSSQVSRTRAPSSDSEGYSTRGATLRRRTQQAPDTPHLDRSPQKAETQQREATGQATEADSLKLSPEGDKDISNHPEVALFSPDELIDAAKAGLSAGRTNLILTSLSSLLAGVRTVGSAAQPHILASIPAVLGVLAAATLLGGGAAHATEALARLQSASTEKQSETGISTTAKVGYAALGAVTLLAATIVTLPGLATAASTSAPAVFTAGANAFKSNFIEASQTAAIFSLINYVVCTSGAAALKACSDFIGQYSDPNAEQKSADETKAGSDSLADNLVNALKKYDPVLALTYLALAFAENNVAALRAGDEAGAEIAQQTIAALGTSIDAPQPVAAVAAAASFTSATTAAVIAAGEVSRNEPHNLKTLAVKVFKQSAEALRKSDPNDPTIVVTRAHNALDGFVRSAHTTELGSESTIAIASILKIVGTVLPVAAKAAAEETAEILSARTGAPSPTISSTVGGALIVGGETIGGALIYGGKAMVSAGQSMLSTAWSALSAYGNYLTKDIGWDD